ncbi:MAG: Smr/MutS family protein [Treponema sp.]|jgi:DNA-nicking Smr family endonuclease|nr:Smr/MutS family protein [Treponema sp.]
MDFGDILDKWDHQTGRTPGTERSLGKKAPRITAEQKTDILSAWLRINDVVDKDAELFEAAAPFEKGERRRRLRSKRPDASLDLHGQTRDEAWLSLDEFFRLSRQQSFEKLLIIHGKGNHSEGEATLKRVVQSYIERCAFAGESGQSTAAEGGSGATWVLLKQE